MNLLMAIFLKCVTQVPAIENGILPKNHLSFLWGQDIMNISAVLCCRSMEISDIIKVWRDKSSFMEQSKEIATELTFLCYMTLITEGYLSVPFHYMPPNYISVFINTFSPLFPMVLYVLQCHFIWLSVVPYLALQLFLFLFALSAITSL